MKKATTYIANLFFTKKVTPDEERTLFQIIKFKLNWKWKNYQYKRFLKQGRNEILNYYSAHPTDNKEINHALNYLKKHPLCIFPDTFTLNYAPGQVEVHKESSNGLLYVIHQGKKLFFKRSFSLEATQHCYCSLLREQDKESPHCYIDKNFEVKQGDVIFDIGSAEGIFPLSNIEKASQVVLFEEDREWLEALEATFEPYKEKVTVLTKYVSDCDDDKNISIDTFLKTYPHRPDFIKIDVEGAECSVLNGMNENLEATSTKIAICTYHKANDYDDIRHRLSARGFKVTPSRGLMIFLPELPLKPPYFRKGLIRAEKMQ